MVPKKEIYCQLPMDVYDRLPELLKYLEMPSITKLVEFALILWIEDMDNGKSRDSNGNQAG